MPSSPPPLPASLSSRLQSSIDPLTGSCRHHPQVKLCELVQNSTRWVVRRKICYKCGTGKNGRYHRPGVAIKKGVDTNKKEGGDRKKDAMEGGRRSRSASIGRSRSVSRGGQKERGGSVNRRSGVSRERSSSRSSSRLSARDAVRDNAVVTPSAAAAAVVTGTKQRRESKEIEIVPPPPEEEFDESDPVIFVPTLPPDEELPPPPPMTDREAGRHAERLEMRRVHDKEKESKVGGCDNNNDVTNGKDDNGRNDKSPVKKQQQRRGGESKSHLVDSKKERQGGEGIIMPSASAMALLNQTHDKRKSVTTTDNNKEEEASETSSISTASAKMYQLEPDDDHPNHKITSSSPHPNNTDNTEPPREIIPSRSRSISRTRTKKSVDPEEECRELVVVDTAVKKERRNSAKKSENKKQPRAKSVDPRTRRKTVSVIQDPIVVASSKSVTVKSIPHAQVKELSASATRMSKRRQSMSKSVATTGGHRQQQRSSRQVDRSVARSRRTTTTGQHRSNSRSRKILDEANDVCSVLEQNATRSRRSRSRSRSRKILNEADDVCSVLEQSRNKASSKQLLGSSSKHASSTACTQPLSVSSDSMKDKKDPLPLVIKKKRGVKSAGAGALSKSMPVASIALDCSDHQSHASSMSNSSDVEVETFVYSEDGKKEGGRGEDGKPKGIKSATVMIVKDVKGGAAELARQGRSTFVGLKGTSKKWQSALFM